METLPADKLVLAYMNLRKAIEQHEAEVKELKEKQQQITDSLLEICAAQNTDGMRTPYGTVSRRINTTYWTSDWEKMYEFIKDHDAFHLLERRISNGNMKTFLEANPDTLPIGLQSDKKFVLTVRKPSAN